MVHKNVRIGLTVKARRTETPGYQSVIFERPRGFDFESGDWMDIDFAGQDLRGGKTYSLASSPTEQDLMITFRTGLSPFKKALGAAEAGQKLVITQYGNDYGFHLRDNRASTLIAGGVGIAPFRSMLKELYDAHANNSVRVLFLNQTEDYLFKNELDTWQKALPNLQLTYVATKGLKRKDREKTLKNIVTGPQSQYYIAGPEGMVASTVRFLESAGIDRRDIRTDSFGGY